MIRHPPVLVRRGTCYGRREFALAPGWRGWAASLCDRPEGLPAAPIRSSPQRRCAMVAHRLSQLLRQPVVLDERLLELDFGDWEGRRWDALPRSKLDRWAADPERFRAPGGESVAELMDRVGGFARMLMQDARSCIVVSHGGPLRLLSAQLRGAPIDLLAASPGLGSLELVRCRG